MRAGALDQRVSLQARLAKGVQDPKTGDVARPWYEVDKVWAGLEFLSVKEFIQAGAARSQVVVRIKIRFRPDVVPSMRVVHRDRIYNIEGALPDNKSGQEYLTLACSGGVNEG